MGRYVDTDESLVEVFLNTVEESFPYLQVLNTKLLFDTKKRISKGRIVLASIESTNEKLRFFSKDNIAIEGYDLILIVDQKAWDFANEKDKVRMIRHELKHVELSEDGKVSIVGHEVSDFYEEIKRNQDDPEWNRRLGMIVFDSYEQDKEMAKEAKKANKEVM